METEQEKQVMRRPDTRELVDGIQPIVTREELAAMRREYRETEV